MKEIVHLDWKRVYCNDCGLEFDEEFEIYRCPECYSHSVRSITKKEKNMYKEKLKELKAQAIKLYPSIAKCHQLKSAKVQMSEHLGTGAGEAHIAGNMIYLNPKYCKSHPEEMRNQILGHEFCHLIAPLLYSTKGEGHKPMWKKVMREMGLRPETYHTMEV